MGLQKPYGDVLPRQNDYKELCPSNYMRCLREVDDSSKEKALIYLEPVNYETLDNELKES